MISLDDEIQRNKRYYQSLRDKAVPSKNIKEQTNALVYMIQCMEGVDGERTEKYDEQLSFLKAVLCIIKIIIPYKNVRQRLFIERAATRQSNQIKAFLLRCRKSQVFEILCRLDDTDALMILRKVDCPETILDNLEEAFIRKDRDAFTKLLSFDRCDITELRSTCGILRRTLSLSDYVSALLQDSFSPEALDYLVGKTNSLPDIDEMPDCSEETIAAYMKVVSDTVQQSISEYGIHMPKGDFSLAQLEDACRKCLSWFDESLRTEQLDDVEYSILEGILNRPEAVPFQVHEEEQSAMEVTETTEITKWGSFEDFMGKVKAKYTVAALNRLRGCDTKFFFYNSFLQLNGGEVLSDQCLEKIDKIFRILTQDLLAIDVSEANYAKLLFLYTGKDMLGNGNNKIEWKSCINDLYCFAKYLVVDGRKYKQVEEHFSFFTDDEIASGNKDNSKIADKSRYKDTLQKFYCEFGFHRLKEGN